MNPVNFSSNYDNAYYESRTYTDLEPYLKQLFARHLLQDTRRALDVGCGIGVYCRFLQSQGVETSGIDISKEGTRRSRQNRASATHIPFRDDAFDLVVAAHVIEHLTPPAIKEFLREIARVLNRDGRLFLLTPNLFDLSRLVLRKRWMPDPTHLTMFHPFSLASLMRDNFTEVHFVFKIPFTSNNLPNGAVKCSGNFHGEQSKLLNLALFAFTATPFAYLRRVTHMVATVNK